MERRPLNQEQVESLVIQLEPRIGQANEQAWSSFKRGDIPAALLQEQQAFKYSSFLLGVMFSSGQLSVAQCRQLLEHLGISLGQEDSTPKISNMGHDSALHYSEEED